MVQTDLPDRYLEMVRSNLDQGERIEFVVKQSRWWPAVPFNSIFKPVIIFLTNERMIIVSRHNLGLKRNVTIVPLSALMTIRLEKGLILCSIVFGQLGATSGDIKIIDGFYYHDGRIVLAYLNKMVHKLNKPAPLLKKPQMGSELNRCYNCGEQIVEHAKYCYHCGVRLF